MRDFPSLIILYIQHTPHPYKPIFNMVKIDAILPLNNRIKLLFHQLNQLCINK